MPGRLLLLALVLASPHAAAAADWPVTVSGRFAQVDNLSRTSDAATIKDAQTWELTAGTAWRRQLAPAWQAVAELSATRDRVPDFPALDAWHLAGRGELRRKFGLGPYAPVLGLHAAVTQSDFDESGRSGTQLEAGLSVTRRLSPAWQGTLGADRSQTYARRNPYDVRRQRVFAEATWDVTDRWRLTLGGARLDGEITAHAAGRVYASALAGGFGPAIQAYYNAIPFLTTNSFGPGWVAYRVDARADSLWLGLAPALGDRTSLPLRYERVDVRNRVGVRYVSEIWSLGLVHRF